MLIVLSSARGCFFLSLDIPDNFDPAKFSVETDPKKKAYKVRNQPLIDIDLMGCAVDL